MYPDDTLKTREGKWKHLPRIVAAERLWVCEALGVDCQAASVRLSVFQQDMSDSDEEKSDSSDSDEDDETSGSTESDEDDEVEAPKSPWQPAENAIIEHIFLTATSCFVISSGR